MWFLREMHNFVGCDFKTEEMNIEEVREYIVSLPNVEETNPFGDEADLAVYKIGGRWFAVYLFERPEVLAVKCEPDRAVELRERYEAINPAWHFNKRHWNELRFNALPDEVVKREIRHSYLTVLNKNVRPKSLKLKLIAEAAEVEAQNETI